MRIRMYIYIGKPASVHAHGKPTMLQVRDRGCEAFCAMCSMKNDRLALRVSSGSDSVIRRCWLNVRFARKRTIYEMASSTSPTLVSNIKENPAKEKRAGLEEALGCCVHETNALWIFRKPL